MANVHINTQLARQHRFIVKCDGPRGGAISDLELALSWARQKADELGVNVQCDDWLQIYCKDSELTLVLTEVMGQSQTANTPMPGKTVSQPHTASTLVLDFWTEFKDQFVWDLLPTAFLHDLFTNWSEVIHPPRALGRNQFAQQLKTLLADSTDWAYTKGKRPGVAMSKPEPLVNKYQLKSWRNSAYQGTDPLKRCTPHPLKANYRGFIRS